MGIYVNPGNTPFREAVNSQIYVDKSRLIPFTNSVLNTKQKNICVSRPALVIERKWNKSAQGAIQQIKDRQYTSWIESYTGEILLVGINYHTKKKKYECVIEKYAKL